MVDPDIDIDIDIDIGFHGLVIISLPNHCIESDACNLLQDLAHPLSQGL